MPRLSDVAVPAHPAPCQSLELMPAESGAATTVCPPASANFLLRAAPSREPPFDDEPVAQHVRVIGAHDQQLPFTARQSAPARMRLLASPKGLGAQPPARTDLPEPGGFARRFVIAVIETATGRRNASQLSKHTSPGVLAGLARDAGRIGRLGTPSRPASLHSMHLAEPVDGVIEAAAVVRVEARYRAIALRLEGWNGRWRCVRLQIG